METRKVALVTGGSRGIGKAICERLALDGMDIVFNYNSSEKSAMSTKESCEKAGTRVLAIKADIADSSDCKMLVKEALEFGNGRIDVLVNNAGITRDNLIIRMSDEDLDAVLNVNLKGCFYMMREVSRIMLKQKSGKIINISSVVGLMGNMGQVNYAASKAGVIGMTKSLARELASRKINVNAIAPGMIETDMTGAMTDAAKEKMLGAIPFNSLGTPDDIANVASFLASDMSSYITGQVICVDGGMTI